MPTWSFGLQPVFFLSPSIEAAAKNCSFSCLKLACGLTSLTGLPFPLTPFGLTKTRRSLRRKFPLPARPGPFFLRDLSVKASIRMARTTGKSTSAVTTHRSFFGFGPASKKDPSFIATKLAPSRDLGSALPRMAQTGSSVFCSVGSKSHFSNRPGSFSCSKSSRLASNSALSFSHFSSFLRVSAALISSTISLFSPVGGGLLSLSTFWKAITPLSLSRGTCVSARGKKEAWEENS